MNPAPLLIGAGLVGLLLLSGAPKPGKPPLPAVGSLPYLPPLAGQIGRAHV